MTHRIARLLAVPAVGAYYFEDLAALQSNAMPVPDRYTAEPITPGFRSVREVAEGVSVGLVLSDGQHPPMLAWGDCMAVAYSSKAGRDPVFRTADGLRVLREVAAPLVEGRPVTGFRALAEQVDARLREAEPAGAHGASPSRRDVMASPWRALSTALGVETGHGEAAERRAHTAVRYGVGQALLGAAALTRGVTMAEVIAEEWGLPLPAQPVPIHAQAGADRFDGADKMIARRVASLPHILVDDVATQLGRDGGKLVEYVRWLSGRIRELGGEDYRPTIHVDVHGALGRISGSQPGRILGRLYALEQAAAPYPLRVESPVIAASRAQQIDLMRRLREYVHARGMAVELVADEWANTLEDIAAFVEAGAADMVQIKMPDLGGVHHSVDAVRLCQAHGVGAFLGGSCAETDIAARVAVHVALATQPAIVMAKPGMGVDEAIMLAQNEMTRSLAWIAERAN